MTLQTPRWLIAAPSVTPGEAVVLVDLQGGLDAAQHAVVADQHGELDELLDAELGRGRVPQLVSDGLPLDGDGEPDDDPVVRAERISRAALDRVQVGLGDSHRQRAARVPA